MFNENKSLRGNKDRHVFTSILKCGDCGRALIYKEREKGYKCAGSQDGSGCSTHLVKEEELFELIKARVIQYVNENIKDIKNNFKNVVKKNNDILYYESQIKEIDLQIEQSEKIIYEAYSEFKSGVIKELIYKSIIKENEKKLEKLNKHKNLLLGKTTKFNTIVETANSKLDNIEELIIKDNRIFKVLLKYIRIYEDNRIEIVWKY